MTRTGCMQHIRQENRRTIHMWIQCATAWHEEEFDKEEGEDEKFDDYLISNNINLSLFIII